MPFWQCMILARCGKACLTTATWAAWTVIWRLHAPILPPIRKDDPGKIKGPWRLAGLLTLSACHEGETLEQLHVLLILQECAM